MKYSLLATSGLMALFTTIVVSSNLPFVGELAVPTVAQAENQERAIKLEIAQSKKVGSKLVPINKNSSVKPGDVIVYSIVAKNVTNSIIKELKINQKIQSGTVYEGGSATAVTGAELTFSVDGGQIYSPKPLFNKKPAPASAYTNVRWLFSTVAPNSKSTVSYAVIVR
jgi:uncharacterized repeat protein (TIGR01451 family)